MTPIANPYYDACRDYLCRPGQYFPPFMNRSIPVSQWPDRYGLCQQYAWACPSDQIGPQLVDLGITRLVEIGAGTGYWKWFLAQFGVDVIAYDRYPYRNRYAAGHWADVQRGGAGQVKYHPDRALMLCWPPLNNRMGFNALRQYQGQWLVYIGEDHGGCCAEDLFFDLRNQQFEWVWTGEPPNWFGIRSTEQIWKRKTV